MKAPSLQKTAALSTALHVTVVLLAALITRQTNHMLLPSAYIVTLIGPADRSRGGESRGSVAEEKAVEPAVVENSKPAKTKLSKEEEKKAEDRIAEIAAAKKIERIVNIRRSMLSIKGSTQKSGAKMPAGSGSPGTAKGTAGAGGYEDKIRTEIMQQWIWPDTNEKNLEAVIAVKILKDGTIVVQNFEKKSGNRLFDSLALKTLAKASPVTPPSYEMEIGIKFYP